MGSVDTKNLRLDFSNLTLFLGTRRAPPLHKSKKTWHLVKFLLYLLHSADSPREQVANGIVVNLWHPDGLMIFLLFESIYNYFTNWCWYYVCFFIWFTLTLSCARYFYAKCGHINFYNILCFCFIKHILGFKKKIREKIIK